MRKPGFETLCAHAGEDPSQYHGAVVPPIYQNSLFASPDTEQFVTRNSGSPPRYDYTRIANPTTDILQAKLAQLEQAEAARCFGSGMAAITAVILSCVSAGDHVVAVDTSYGPARQFLRDYLPRFGISTAFVDGVNTQQIAEAIVPTTRLIYLETPSSMVMRLQDLRAISAMVKPAEIVTAVDNSWASPYFQNPITLGIDLVLHSATKYLGGHSDIVAGAVMGSAARISALTSAEGALLGAVLDPFAAWLMLRGLRTLPVRMDRHMQTAMRIAVFLERHPAVAHVYYPGLPTHPQYALGRSQMRGYSGLLSFSLHTATREAAFGFVDRLHYFGIGVSWGGFESLAVPVGFPAPLEGESYGNDSSGTVPWGARLHIGLETADDLIEDLEQALAPLC